MPHMQEHHEKVQELQQVQGELKKQLSKIPSLIWFFLKLIGICLVVSLVLVGLYLWHPW